MELRICLRKLVSNCSPNQLQVIYHFRLMNKLEEDKSRGEREESKWFEHVHDLWSEHKLQHLRDVSAPQPIEDVFDPTTGLYGFQVVDHEAPVDDESIEAIREEKQPINVSSSQQQLPVQDQVTSIEG